MLVELASGVDALYLSGRTEVPPVVLDYLDQAKDRAREMGESVEIDFGGERWSMLSRGFGNYRYALVSERAQLGVTPSERFPALRFQPRAELLHSLGPAGVVDWIRSVAEWEFGDVHLGVSRIDLFADFEGWALDGDQRHRFACRADTRTTYEESEELTGFTFGRRTTKTYAARIYDKTKDVKLKGADWWHDKWAPLRQGDSTVVRVEFEIGREAIRQFGLDRPQEVLASVRDLWAYGTGEWLSYRSPTSDKTKSRWPVADEWQAVQAATFEGELLGLERIRDGRKAGSLRKILPPLNGYLVSFAVHAGTDGIGDTLDALRVPITEYERISGVSFAERVRAKRAQWAAL